MQYKSFENTVGKGEIAHTELFFPWFSTRFETSLLFSSNLNFFLNTLSFWKSLKFAIWERSKLGAFNKEKLKVAEMAGFVSERLENIIESRRLSRDNLSQLCELDL